MTKYIEIKRGLKNEGFAVYKIKSKKKNTTIIGATKGPCTLYVTIIDSQIAGWDYDPASLIPFGMDERINRVTNGV